MPYRFRPALLLALWAPAQAHADCPPPSPRVLLEHFVAARCVGCWQVMPPRPLTPRDAWVLDWVVPAPADTPPPTTPRQAFLHGAAMQEAGGRMTRLGGPLAADETFTLSHPLPQRSALDVQVSDTRLPAGKIGLQLTVSFNSQRPLPANAQGWLAVIERLPLGDEKSPVSRQLVRAVVGPLSLAGLEQHPITHLRSVDMPAQGDPKKFSAIGWVETGRGRVIAMGRGVLPDCPKN